MREEIERIEDYFLELSDYASHDLPIAVEITNHTVSKNKNKIDGFKILIKYDMYDQEYVKSCVKVALNRISREYNIHYNQISKVGHGSNRKELPVYGKTTTSTVYDPIWWWYITITPKKIIENINGNSTLLIVDVQKSFKKFFNEMYINELSKYCKSFTSVYQIFDNHVHGKNVDKDYLYDKDPDIENTDDLYTFPNQKDLIEKRYNYDVDVEFYKKVLDVNVYKKIKSQEKNLRKGQYFPTTEGTIIVYIGNNHQWFHIPKKLYELFMKFKEGQNEITIVGGASSECLTDIVMAAKALGVKIKEDYKFIYSATYCPVK
jgi:hypothetical protein